MKVAIHSLILVAVCVAAAWGSAQAEPQVAPAPVVAR